MIPYNDALKKVEMEFEKLKVKTEKADLLDSINRIVAEDIYSDTDQPLFTNSSMDGFAVKYVKGNNRWKIIGEIKSGGYKNINVRPGESVRIMTGSKLPPGADTVIPIENMIEDNNFVNCLNNILLRKGLNVRQQGEDIREGNLLIRKNTILNSNNIAIAASCGKKTIKVYSKLKIGVLATGDELVDININPKGDKLRASNLYSLLSAIQEMNMIPVSFGIVKDKKQEIIKRIQEALNSGIDILLTTGGVSAGKYDYLIDVFKELGVKIIFSKVNIKPGKPVVFGIYNKNRKRVLVFGLPGNPVSCYVNFILFVKNAIMNRLSLNNNHNTTAILNQTLTKRDNKRHFLRGIIQNKKGINFVSHIGSQSSANIDGLNSANCLIVFNEKIMRLKQGNKVECIMI